MASVAKPDELTHLERADVSERVDRFYAAWTADRENPLEPYLPAEGSRTRWFALLDLIKTDMGLRIAVGKTTRVEDYLDRFRDEIPADAVPVALVVEEYLHRLRHGQRPTIEEYQARFPICADAIALHLRQTGSATPNQPPAGTVGIETADPGPPAAGRTIRAGETVPSAVWKAAPAAPADVTPAGPDHGLLDSLPADLQYKLVRRIGVGSFGEVYEAIAPGGFRVAIKKILRAVDHPASQGEIDSLDAMKAMSHPFLLQTHAYWIYRDRLVIVMELADGSLAGRIEHFKASRTPGVPPAELIPIFEQTAEALDYLNSKNITHRDVKPENLLLLKGYAKVADFGLARLQRHQVTVVGVEVGTPMFMAPEVWQGKVSIQSDQYSLAATYVTARLGRPMFSAQKMHELCFQHLNGTPKLDPLPPAEQQVILKALAKKPEERYPTCAAFVKALRAVVLAPTQRRRPVAWIAAAVAALLIVGLAVGLTVTYFSKTPPTEPERASLSILPGWTAAPDAATHTLPTGRVVPTRLTRPVGVDQVELVLVVPAEPNDPPAFYMLRNKVTNRVFRTVWEAETADPNSRPSQFLRLHDKAMTGALVPGKWRDGAIRNDGKPLGNSGTQDTVPVVGVTAPEAMLVAAELGGRLPTMKQWRKAVGANGEDSRPGPAGEKELPGEDLSKRPLALGLRDGPWPVTKETKDVSVHGIHQLTTNGFEWTDGADEPQRIDLFARSAQVQKLPLAGQSWDIPVVLTFAGMAGPHTLVLSWTDTAQLIGFRIVLTP